jgi:formate dehydrogenase subunit gamma
MRMLYLALSLALAAGSAVAQQAPQSAQDDPPGTREEAQQQRRITQPGNNAPVWREVQSGAPNYTSIPGRETGVLIQPPARFVGQEHRSTAGEAWRQFRNGPMTFYGGWLVLLALIAIAALYFTKGAVKLHEPRTGRKLLRFTPTERVVHWSVAISFCILGLSGLTMLFGKHILLPIVGYTIFGWLGNLAKNLHNFIAPFFMVAIVVMVLIWIRDNLPKAYDIKWLTGAWAFFVKGKHIPSGRFNGGEKAWFWIGVVGLSVVVSWSGLILLFPNFDQTRATMQDAWVWHASAALLYIAISLGHIYMGTIGVEGAYENMREGYTDETWAREHHEYWYNEVKSGQPRAPGGAIPAGAPHMKEKS